MDALDEVLAPLLDQDLQDSPMYWDRLSAVVDAADAATVAQAAIDWCQRATPGHRAVGLDLLGVVVQRMQDLTPTLLAEVERLATSDDNSVRWSAAHALGRRRDSALLPALLRFLEDPDAEVRLEVVCDLPALAPDDLAVDHPIVLGLLSRLEDDHPDVRDWAAFGLGVQLDADSPAIRDALARHLATAELGDERLLPLLHRLLERGWQDDAEPRPGILDDAITSCTSREC